MEDKNALRALQMVEKDILKDVVSICETHNLRYFLIEGSLLGAVRHRGFIPWDDDIDIGLPREDYERFLSLAPSLLKEKHKLVTYRDVKSVFRYFAQVECPDIQVRTHAQQNGTTRNAWIDLFPLDGMPNHAPMRFMHMLTILALRAAIQFSQFDDIVNMKKQGRPMHERCLIGFARVTRLGQRWDTVRIMDRFDGILKRYDYKKSRFIVNATSAYKSRAVFMREDFGEGSGYVFEGLPLNGPARYEPVLRQVYGDGYMSPPPVGERDWHWVEVVAHNL